MCYVFRTNYSRYSLHVIFSNCQMSCNPLIAHPGGSSLHNLLFLSLICDVTSLVYFECKHKIGTTLAAHFQLSVAKYFLPVLGRVLLAMHDLRRKCLFQVVRLRNIRVCWEAMMVVENDLSSHLYLIRC